jgi:hypothetical protein
MARSSQTTLGKENAMIEFDTNSRLQGARQHQLRLADEMRRSRRLTPDEVGYPGWARLGSALAGRVDRLRRRRGHGAPVFEG